MVGLPYSGRTRSQLEGLVGNFINMLPIRTNLPADTSFQTLLKTVQQSITAALSHSELPFNKLVEGMGISRSADRTPVFQAVVDLLESPASTQAEGLVRGPVEPPVSIISPCLLERLVIACIVAVQVLAAASGYRSCDCDSFHSESLCKIHSPHMRPTSCVVFVTAWRDGSFDF